MRENKGKRLMGKTVTDKIIIYSAIGVAILAAIVFSLLMYSKSLSDDVKNSTMSLEKMASIGNNSNNNSTENQTQSASTEIGKNVSESKNEIDKENAEGNNTNTDNKINSTNTANTNATTSSSNINDTKNNSKNNNTANIANASNTTNSAKTSSSNNSTTNAKQEAKETKKELSFEKPVDGEISKEFAQENLVYSETLKEWTTHTGIDIKAEKTTVVKAAEEGTVKSIKNDPRYGLTVVIEHEDGFETIYANLLTSEFVVEGEKVKKGQAIGTVGKTAVFEIADEAHLHFEIQKDAIPQDPNVYIK